MERLGADSGKMTLNICKFRIFFLNLKGCYANIYPFQNWKGSLYCGHPFPTCVESVCQGVVFLDTPPNKLGILVTKISVTILLRLRQNTVVMLNLTKRKALPNGKGCCICFTSSVRIVSPAYRRSCASCPGCPLLPLL